MGQGAKPAKAKVEARPPVARKSRKADASTQRQLEQRLAEALEQQAATSEILHAISSSPTDLDPAFRMILANAIRLCGASVATLWLFDGELLTSVANQNASPAFAEYLARARIRPGRETTTRRAALERKTIHVADLLSDPDYSPPEFQRKEKVKTVLSVPLLRQDTLVGVVTLWRREVRPFTDRQVALVETFADQAVIAIENVRLFNETKEALDQQTATAQILQAISSSPGDLRPVFDAVVRAAAQFCGASNVLIMRLDQGVLRGAAAVGPFADVLMRRAGSLEAIEIPVTKGTVAGRSVVECRTIHVHDLAAERKDEYPEGRELQRRFGHRTLVATPLLREGVPLGVIVLFRTEVKPFSDRQIALLQTFADQAVIAIENVRLFKELETRNRDLTEALEQQTATSDILRVISQSPTDVQPVFDTIAGAALKLCRATSANVFTYDGELVHLAAMVNLDPTYKEVMREIYPRPLSRDTTVLRAIQTRSVVVIPDVLEDEDYISALGVHSTSGGFRSVLAVPLMREGHAIGGIAVGRAESGSFPDTQVELLKTFADQAVIAIENVRLFNELENRNRDLTEALEQQTSTSDILRVISQSPTDVQPVFDTIAAAALKLCRASSGAVMTFDGELIHLAAVANLNPEGADAIRKVFPRPPGRDMAATRAVLTCGVVAISDVLEDHEFGPRSVAVATGFRSVLAVPLVRDGNPIGAIAVGRPQPGPFPAKQIALLQTFADQAVIAIENVRLFTELEARNRDLTEALEQQTATSEILRVISRSPRDVQPVFDAIAGAALRLCGANRANVFTTDGNLLHVAAFASANPGLDEEIRRHFPRPLGRDLPASRAILTGAAALIPDVLKDPQYALKEFAPAGGFRSVLAVPLLREGSSVGAIGVSRPEPGPFPDTQIALLQTFADQAVIAIENVRLFTELEARTTELTRSVGELKALGEVGQAVSSTLDLETVLNTIVSRATQLAGMDGGSIWEYDETREEFYLHATDKLPGELVEALRATAIKKGEGAVGRLAVTGEPVQIRDIVDEGVYQSRVREILIRLGYRSLLAVPLLREDHLLGGLAVNRKSAGEFAPEVIDLLKTFATQSALAIQNARLFREIEIKSRELEIASQHKSEFLANMSHELRTPLNAIIGFSEVLSERMFGEVNDKQAEYLSDILESGRHLLSLINDILDLSKIEAGRMELEPSEFDLPTAIENTLILVRERAQRRGIALGRTVDERLGMIRADERKVKQVLLNLLSNALKFTPEGGRIDVVADVHDGATEISVTDTGVGIAPEDQEAVFEEFRQVGTAARKVEGTGLGLAISRKFIELHGGRIWVESQVGMGSKFAFTLPLTIDQRHPTG